MDSFIFLPDSVKPTKLEESDAVNKGPYTAPQSDAQEMSKNVADKETEVDNIERPVDLYKVLINCFIL